MKSWKRVDEKREYEIKIFSLPRVYNLRLRESRFPKRLWLKNFNHCFSFKLILSLTYWIGENTCLASGCSGWRVTVARRRSKSALGPNVLDSDAPPGRPWGQTRRLSSFQGRNIVTLKLGANHWHHGSCRSALPCSSAWQRLQIQSPWKNWQVRSDRSQPYRS